MPLISPTPPTPPPNINFTSYKPTQNPLQSCINPERKSGILRYRRNITPTLVFTKWKIRTANSQNFVFALIKLVIIVELFYFFLSMGSVQANIQVLAVINTNTTGKVEALNHLVEGLNSAVGKVLNVTTVRVLGKRTGKTVLFRGTFLHSS